MWLFNINSQNIQTAVVKWVENKYQNDLNGMTKMYTELQELFQVNSLGQKQIFDLSEKIKLQPPVHPVKKKEEKPTAIKKSFFKTKSTILKNSIL